MAEERMLIRMESNADTESARQALEQAGIPVQIEQDGADTLLYVTAADGDRAEAALKAAGLIGGAQPESMPAQSGGKRSVLLTLMMLVLIALAVYGTDFIVELLRKLFQ